MSLGPSIEIQHLANVYALNHFVLRLLLGWNAWKPTLQCFEWSIFQK